MSDIHVAPCNCQRENTTVRTVGELHFRIPSDRIRDPAVTELRKKSCVEVHTDNWHLN